MRFLITFMILIFTSCFAFASDVVDASNLFAMLPAWVQVTMTILSVLVVAGQAIVAITPSKSDDAFLMRLREMPVVGHLLKSVTAFAPLQKTEILKKDEKAKNEKILAKK